MEEVATDVYPEVVRFNLDADDYEEVVNYLRNRLLQLLAAGRSVVWIVLKNRGYVVGKSRVD
jgi:hypothetical protein